MIDNFIDFIVITEHNIAHGVKIQKLYFCVFTFHIIPTYIYTHIIVLINYWFLYDDE